MREKLKITELKNKSYRELSGGQQQRVCFFLLFSIKWTYIARKVDRNRINYRYGLQPIRA